MQLNLFNSIQTKVVKPKYYSQLSINQKINLKSKLYKNDSMIIPVYSSHFDYYYNKLFLLIYDYSTPKIK